MVHRLRHHYAVLLHQERNDDGGRSGDSCPAVDEHNATLGMSTLDEAMAHDEVLLEISRRNIIYNHCLVNELARELRVHAGGYL